MGRGRGDAGGQTAPQAVSVASTSRPGAAVAAAAAAEAARVNRVVVAI